MGIELRPEEVTSILKAELAGFEGKSENYEIGTVLSVGDGIARVHGLENVMAGELVEFSDGLVGMALNLEEDNVGIAIFGSDTTVSGRRPGQAHEYNRISTRRARTVRPRS